MEQIIVESSSGSFSDGGDSGSIIVNSDNRSVGLLFAGSDTSTIANPIDLVVNNVSGNKNDSLNLSMDNTDAGPPAVAWVNPVDGDTVSGSVSIEIDASDEEDSDSNLTVEWQVDDGTWNEATYDSNSGNYTDSWDSTGVHDGDHNLDARATDTDGATSSEERITVTVDNTSDSTASGMGVADTSFSEKNYGGGKFTDLTTTVSVHEDTDGDGTAETSDDPVGGATVNMTLTHDSDGDGDFDSNDDSWNFSGDTDSQGDVEFTLKKAPNGDYKTEVTDITHSSYTYDSSLDADNPDTYTIN